MVLHHKAARGQLRQLARAGMDVIDGLAAPALKMMVMGMPVGPLKARRVTRQLHGLRLSLQHQGIELSVHRGQAHPWCPPLGPSEHFLRQQRPRRLLEGALYGGALSGLAFHGGDRAGHGDK